MFSFESLNSENLSVYLEACKNNPRYTIGKFCASFFVILNVSLSYETLPFMVINRYDPVLFVAMTMKTVAHFLVRYTGDHGTSPFRLLCLKVVKSH